MWRGKVLAWPKGLEIKIKVGEIIFKLRFKKD
jgi:hypothetical protein